jgi:hypothetical protein
MYTPTIGARTCNVATQLFSGQFLGPTAPNKPADVQRGSALPKKFLWLLVRQLESPSCTKPITIDLYA